MVVVDIYDSLTILDADYFDMPNLPIKPKITIQKINSEKYKKTIFIMHTALLLLLLFLSIFAFMTQ